MNMFERLNRLYQRIPLMPKMLIITVAAGALATAVIDAWQLKTLQGLFGGVLREQLGRQADEDRVRFDNYMETYHEAAKLISSRKGFQDYIDTRFVRSPRKQPPVVYRDLPDWLPDAAMLRHMVRIQNALLLDGAGRVRELYNDGSGAVPPELRSPSARLLALSADQSAMVTLDKRPYVVTSMRVRGTRGRSAVLMIASELNEDLLTATQGGASEERLVAILGGERPVIIASTRPDILPSGAPLAELQKDFLVTGKSFFDSGASELMMQFASFIPRKRFGQVLGTIVSADRKQRTAMAVVLIAAGLIVVYFITRAVQQLARRVVEVSRDELGLEYRDVPRGDQLFVLRMLFQRFMDEVIASRERLRQQAEQSLKASETKYQLLHESMRDAFVSTDLEGRIVDFNRAYQEMLGYSREDLKKLSSGELTPQKWHETDERIVRDEILPFGHSEVYEKEYARRDGIVFPVELRTFLLKDESGNDAGMWSIVRDITERKKVEQELLVKESAMATALTGIALADFSGIITYANAAFLRIWGYERDEDVVGRKAIDFWVNRDEAAAVVAALGRDGVWSGELTGKRRDGSVFDAQLAASMVNDRNGTPVCMMASFMDVTERREFLRRLEESEQKFRAVFDFAHDGILVADAETGRFLLANKKACEMLGYGAEELDGIGVRDIHPSESLQLVGSKFQDILDRKTTLTEDVPVLRKNGTVFRADISASPVELQGRLYAIGIFRDITERLEAQALEQEFSRRQQAILNNIPDMAWLKDREGRFLAVNEPFGAASGMAPEALVGKNDFDIWPPDLAERYRSDDRAVMASGMRKQVEEPLIDSRGRKRLIETIKTPIVDAQGGRIGTTGIARDITDRKRAEQLLRDSEEQLRRAQEVAHIGNWQLDIEENRLVWSDEVFRIFEIDRERIGASYEAFLNVVHPDDRKAVNDAYRDSVRNRAPYSITHRLLMPDGRVKYMREIAETSYDDKGRPLRSFGTVQDITEIKLAEQRYGTILQTAMDGFWLADVNGRLLDVNESYCRMSGYSREELLRMSIPDLETGETPEETRRHIASVIARGHDRFLSKHRRKDGTVMDVEISVQFSKEQDGMFVAFLQDITERKRDQDRIEASLREKETLLREIHHRVKNNLQIISSLLYFQAKNVQDPAGLAALREGQDRLKSMILVHEKLYRSRDLGSVDFGDYVRTLIDQMLQSYAGARNSVALDVVAGDIRLPIETALPCGMIINELLTNVFKYAFPGNVRGSATVRVDRSDHLLTVGVSDNGAGLPPGTDTDNPSTFGLQLVRNLTNQLGGRAVVASSPGAGTSVTIEVPLDGQERE